MQGNNDLFAVLLARAMSGGGAAGTVTSITAGTGLTTADGSAITTSGTIKTKLASETALSGNDVYPVGVNDNGELAVEVSMSASDVGLGNVTNDAQVKKIPSSTSGDIVTWSAATGDTVADSGKSFETTLTSSSDVKIPTSKAVASYVSNEIGKLDGGTIGTGSAAKTITALSQSNGNVSATFADIAITASQSTLGSWTAGTATTHSTPTGTDTVLQALQKIDNNQRNDEAITSRIVMDSTENQDYYMQDSTPSNPQEGDYWFTDEPIVSADVSAMTGYAKAQSASAIAATDTLNEAVGKLEKKADDNTSGLSSKQNQVLGSWTAGTATSHVTPTGTDTVLQALQKIDNNQRNDENNISLIDHASGTKLFFTETEPTGTVPVGSYWISKSGNKVYAPTANLFNEIYTGLNTDVTYKPMQVGDIDVTLSTTAPKTTQENAAVLFLIAGNVSAGASTNDNGAWNGQNRTVSAIDGYITIGYRHLGDVNPQDYKTMLNAGDTALPYVAYGNAWQ